MTILVLAPHPDDEVLGVGGTMSKMAAAGEDVQLAIVTGLGEEPHPFVSIDAWERVQAECKIASKILGVSNVYFGDLPTVCLDHQPVWKINKKIYEIIEAAAPDQLYLPFPYDLHKDHGAVAYAGVVAARPYLSLGKSIKRVCFYETLTETHLSAPYLDPAFQPNMFVDISEHLDRKIEAMESYRSQLQSATQPRSSHGLRTLAHFRGMHVGVNAAESFVIAREFL